MVFFHLLHHFSRLLLLDLLRWRWWRWFFHWLHDLSRLLLLDLFRWRCGRGFLHLLWQLRWGCFLQNPRLPWPLRERWWSLLTLLLRDHKKRRRCFSWHRFRLDDPSSWTHWRCLFQRLRFRHLALLSPRRRSSRRKRPGPGFLLHHCLARRSAVRKRHSALFWWHSAFARACWHSALVPRRN